ncbi:MAG: glycosyltransferase [Patescibacteria group bacterium]|nr:glycosyltransferase [Patescibacteria group bacterium]
MNKIDIIIPSYNAAKNIAELLLSLRNQTFKEYSCFVIDDNSSDNTVEIVKNNFPWVNVIAQKKNVGPARAKNIGAAGGNSPYLVFFDSDIFLTDPEWLAKALNKIQSSENIGQIASMIVSGFDEDILLDCGIQGEGPFFGGIYHKKNVNDVLGKHKIERRVLAACTAGTIIRREVFEKVGNFDAKYYYPAEDLDLSLRVHLAGYEVIYDPRLVVHHYESMAMGKKEKRKFYLHNRNSLMTLWKNYPLKYALNKTGGLFRKKIKNIGWSFLRGQKKFFSESAFLAKLIIFFIFNSPRIIIKRIGAKKYLKRSRYYLVEIGQKLTAELALILPVKSLIFSVTNICNARCKMCFQKSLNQKIELLALDEIRKIFASVKGLNNIVLGGGEPFLRPDIDQICRILINSSNPSITIPTNGSLPEIILAKTKRILGYGARRLIISFSLDGLKQYHEANRGIAGLFEKVKESYDKIARLKEIYGDKLRIQVNTCLSKDNFGQVDGLGEYLAAEMPRAEWTLEPIRGCFDQSKATPLSPEEWEKMLKKIGELNGKNNSSSSEKLKKIFEYSITTLKNKTQIIPCLGGSEFIAMDYFGNIAPCEILPAIANIKNIDYDFNNLLANEKWLEAQKQIKQKKCYCTHFCWLAYSLEKMEKKK